MPLPAWEEDTGWAPEPMPAAALPRLRDPGTGFVATANNLPAAGAVHLGADFLDGYRAARIAEMLSGRADWDVPGTLAAQMDRVSLPWRELREPVLSAAAVAGDLGIPVDLLRAWDGVVSPDSPAASLFEVFVAELAIAIARTRAPLSTDWVLGAGFTPLIPYSGFLVRRVSHLCRLVRERPPGWFDDWDEALRAALRSAHRLLATRYGPAPAGWAWGTVRPLTFKHPLGLRPPLDRVYNLGPVPHGGDANTVNPAPVDPADPTGNPDFAVASLRMAVDVGNWELSRFVLPGGQSGNPFSPHYADQFDLWRKGDAFPIAWSPEAVARATRTTLVLQPSGSGASGSARSGPAGA